MHDHVAVTIEQRGFRLGGQDLQLSVLSFPRAPGSTGRASE
jgi:hypothetical protein